MTFLVRVEFDETLRRFFVQQSDILGLNVEADDFEELVEIVRDVALDLMGATHSGASIKFERQIALV